MTILYRLATSPLLAGSAVAFCAYLFDFSLLAISCAFLVGYGAMIVLTAKENNAD